MNLAAILLAAATATSTAAAPAGGVAGAKGSPSVVIGGEAGELSSGESAVSGSVDLRWTAAGGETLALGAATHSVAGTRWSFGRLAGVTRVAGRLALDGDVAAGSGRRGGGGGAPFSYLSMRAGATLEVSPGRLWVAVADRFIDVAPQRGHLPEAGLTARLRGGTTLAFRYGRSVGGNLGTEYGSARLDSTVRRLGVVAGVALGRSAPEVFDLVVGDGGRSSELRQLFAGARLPLPRGSLTLIADRLEVGATARSSLTLVLELPLTLRGRGP